MAKVPGLFFLLCVAGACDGADEGGLERGLGDQDAAVDEAPDGGASADAAAQVTPPEGCDEEVTLAPESAGLPASDSVGPFDVDQDGVDICLHLDGTAIGRNHFMSQSDQEQGEVSSYQLLLIDHDGNVLREGWDVSFGVEDPSTFANVEWAPWGPEVAPEDHLADVVLRARTKTDAPAPPTRIDVALFDPLE